MGGPCRRPHRRGRESPRPGRRCWIRPVTTGPGWVTDGSLEHLDVRSMEVGDVQDPGARVHDPIPLGRHVDRRVVRRDPVIEISAGAQVEVAEVARREGRCRHRSGRGRRLARAAAAVGRRIPARPGAGRRARDDERRDHHDHPDLPPLIRHHLEHLPGSGARPLRRRDEVGIGAVDPDAPQRARAREQDAVTIR